jgi:hypothetical protein
MVWNAFSKYDASPKRLRQVHDYSGNGRAASSSLAQDCKQSLQSCGESAKQHSCGKAPQAPVLRLVNGLPLQARSWLRGNLGLTMKVDGLCRQVIDFLMCIGLAHGLQQTLRT